MKYEVFEHTADLGIKVFGRSYEELLSNSVEAFADIIIDTRPLVPSAVHHVSFSSRRPDFLLVDLLSDLLLEFETTGYMYFEPHLRYSEELVRIEGEIRGAPTTEDMEFRNIIKAVTYHNLEVAPELGYAKIVFDL